jgi:hypothetical protein
MKTTSWPFRLGSLSALATRRSTLLNVDSSCVSVAGQRRNSWHPARMARSSVSASEVPETATGHIRGITLALNFSAV